MAVSVKYLEKKKLVDKKKNYTVDEAVSLLKEISYTKFDGTADLSINLGVDPRHADQMVRSTVVLPNGLGKVRKILVIAQGEKEREAKESGADFVGSLDMIEKIKGGWLDFDVVISTPDMMKEVGKIGKILGPKGLMPNPKSGTVTFELKSAIEEFKKGKIEFRVDKYGVVHIPFGKISFPAEKLKENFFTILDTIIRAKPATAKGEYIRKIIISPTMGPGIRVDRNLVIRHK